MVYGVAAGAIRVLKHLAFRVLKKTKRKYVWVPSTTVVPKDSEGHGRPRRAAIRLRHMRMCQVL